MDIKRNQGVVYLWFLWILMDLAAVPGNRGLRHSPKVHFPRTEVLCLWEGGEPGALSPAAPPG